MPLRLFSAARIGVGEKGEPVTGDGTPSAPPTLNRNLSHLSIAVNDPIFCGHYFHFVEVVIALFTGIKEFYPNAAVVNCYLMNQNWLNETQNGVQRHLLEAAFPGINIISNVEGMYETDEETLLVFCREWGRTSINKALEPLIWMARHHFKAFSSSMEEYVSQAVNQGRVSKTTPGGDLKKDPIALFVHRNPPRTLSSSDQESLIGYLADQGYSTEIVDYSGMSFFDQVFQTRRSTLMVGVHGNGLTNLMWLPQGSTVIELFPKNSHHYDYQVLSEICGHHYFGVECSSNPYIYRDFSRAGDVYGNVNTSDLILPKDIIANLLAGFNGRADERGVSGETQPLESVENT